MDSFKLLSIHHGESGNSLKIYFCNEIKAALFTHFADNEFHSSQTLYFYITVSATPDLHNA